jgi:hypothetical protein
MHHIEIIAVMALVPLGAWIAMGDGMVLEWWAKLVTKTRTVITPHGRDARGRWVKASKKQVPIIPAFWAKPLATCPRCMVSAWGIPAALLTFPDLNPWLLPVYLLAACGLQEAVHR